MYSDLTEDDDIPFAAARVTRTWRLVAIHRKRASWEWIATLDWAQAKVHVNLSREGIKQSPEYDSSKLISREYETRLYLHHGQTGYWLN